MDLLKAREKAKKQLIKDKKEEKITQPKNEISQEKSIETAVFKQEPIIKKDVKKIEKISQEQILIPIDEQEKKTIRLNDKLKGIVERLFDDIMEEEEIPEKVLQEAPLAPTEEIQLLTFRIGKEFFALNLEVISEIIRYREAALIPNTPDYVHGLMSLRGRMVPIINSHLRLQLPLSEDSTKKRIIIVEIDNEFMGFTVDEAYNVIKINKNMIRPAPPTLTEIELELVAGVCEYKDKLITILNTNNFFKFL